MDAYTRFYGEDRYGPVAPPMEANESPSLVPWKRLQRQKVRLGRSLFLGWQDAHTTPVNQHLTNEMSEAEMEAARLVGWGEEITHCNSEIESRISS